jgi:hypothetical protein
MLEPEQREIVACRTCGDHKRVQAVHESIPCPECKDWPKEKRDDLMRAATRAHAEKPSISETDLSDQEAALVAEWGVLHPGVHRLTLLTWIEGRRYDPAKDPEFLAEARKRFKKWQFLRHSDEGPRPEWVLNAIQTGNTAGLCAADKQYVEDLRRNGNG